LAQGADAGEEPFSGSGLRSLDEDVAESATAYFLQCADFKNRCPERFEVIDAAVKAWAPAPPPAAAADALQPTTTR
jgi:hypothetical protein